MTDQPLKWLVGILWLVVLFYMPIKIILDTDLGGGSCQDVRALAVPPSSHAHTATLCASPGRSMTLVLSAC